jgi:NADPH:quinone reductase-like Zn-dependent oxidoreductase
MKAARMHGLGGPEVLVVDDVTIPQLGDDEVLVRVVAASVNPVDYKIRSGAFRAAGEAQLPLVLGRDVAGVVERCGQRVQRFQPGDAVFALLDRSRGGYAEYVAVGEGICAPKPRALDFEQAAGVPLAGITAWQGLFDHGRLRAGERVLIHGGAGGVGHLAIQLAKQRGAWVATTVSGEDLEFVRGRGADQAIDYHTQRFDDLLHDLDLVLDLVGGETRRRSFALLRRGGRLVSSVGQPDEEEARRRGVDAIGYMAQPSGPELEELSRLIDAGKLRPFVLATYPLVEVRAAHERAEKQHTRGKIVLSVRETRAQA